MTIRDIIHIAGQRTGGQTVAIKIPLRAIFYLFFLKIYAMSSQDLPIRVVVLVEGPPLSVRWAWPFLI